MVAVVVVCVQLAHQNKRNILFSKEILMDDFTLFHINNPQSTFISFSFHLSFFHSFDSSFFFYVFFVFFIFVDILYLIWIASGEQWAFDVAAQIAVSVEKPLDHFVIIKY